MGSAAPAARLVSSRLARFDHCGSVVSTLLIAREQKRTAQAYHEKNQQLAATQRAEQLANEQTRLALQQKAEAERSVTPRARTSISPHADGPAGLERRPDQQVAGSSMRTFLNGSAGLPRLEWYFFLSKCHADLLTLSAHIGEVRSVAWSPDGRRWPPRARTKP